MDRSLEVYLDELRQALDGADRALVQDALWDAKREVEAQLAGLAWLDPALGHEEAMRRALEALGSPEQAAARYRERERVVDEALRPAPVPGSPELVEESPRPWPTFFGILQEPKAYTSVLYLLLSLVTGIFYFTWAITGLSLSLGLLVLVVGLPLLALFLGSFRALALGEGRLVEALLDVRMPRRPTLLPEGRNWRERLGNLFKDGYTWRSLAYLVAQLPLGILYFTTLVSGLSASAALLAMPVFSALLGRGFNGKIGVAPSMVYDSTHLPPLWLAVGLAFLGFFALVGTLHGALALGRLHGRIARFLLVKR